MLESFSKYWPWIVIAMLVLVAWLESSVTRAPDHYPSDEWESVSFAIEEQPDWIDQRAARSAYYGVPKSCLPDPRHVTGAFFAHITEKELAKPGYTQSVRDVPDSVRKQICERDGIKWEDRGKYECDHLVSLELGGSNDPSNLWMQPYTGRWGARVKDQYEDWLHREVVAGHISIRDAQQRIAQDWIGNMQHDMPDYRPPNTLTEGDEA